MDSSSHEQQIRNLLYRYMEATDNGDFDARAKLFEHAVVRFPEPLGAISGAAVAESLRSRHRLYDGIPRTAHLCLTHHRPRRDRDQLGGPLAYLATGDPDLPLQPIFVAATTLASNASTIWRFAERHSSSTSSARFGASTPGFRPRPVRDRQNAA